MPPQGRFRTLIWFVNDCHMLGDGVDLKNRLTPEEHHPGLNRLPFVASVTVRILLSNRHKGLVIRKVESGSLSKRTLSHYRNPFFYLRLPPTSLPLTYSAYSLPSITSSLPLLYSHRQQTHRLKSPLRMNTL